MAHAREEAASSYGLTHFQLLLIWTSQLFQGLQLLLPYTMSAYMVRHFFEGQGYREATLGQLAGLLAASGPFPRSLVSYPWGLISDRLGRKIPVMLGCVAAATGLLLFGASPSYTSAFICRLLPGFLNGCNVSLKAMIGDSCNAHQQAKAMAVLTLGFSFGNVLGPTLGGALAEPCKVYGDAFPFCGPRGLFRLRPFLLPCLVAASLGYFITVMDFLFLRETLPKLRGEPGGWYRQFFRRAGYSRLASGPGDKEKGLVGGSAPSEAKGAGGEGQGDPKGDPPGDPKAPGEPPHLPTVQEARRSLELRFTSDADLASAELRAAESAEAEKLLGSREAGREADREAGREADREASRDAGTEAGREAGATGGGRDGGGAAGEALSPPRGQPLMDRRTSWDGIESAGSLGSMRRSSLGLGRPLLGGSRRRDSAEAEAEAHLQAGIREFTEPQEEPGQRSPPQREAAATREAEPAAAQGAGEDVMWYQLPVVVQVLVGSGLVAFLYNFLEELTPIFVSAPVDQGGLSMPLDDFTMPIVFGGVVMVCFALFGYARLQRALGPLKVVRMGCWGGIPCALLVPSAAFFVPNFYLEQAFLWAALAAKGLFKIMALTSSTILINLTAPKSQMGAVNGAGMSLGSGARTLGPLLGGSAWALGVSLPAFPGKAYVPFSLMALGCLATQLLYTRLQRRMDSAGAT